MNMIPVIPKLLREELKESYRIVLEDEISLKED